MLIACPKNLGFLANRQLKFHVWSVITAKASVCQWRPTHRTGISHPRTASGYVHLTV